MKNLLKINLNSSFLILISLILVSNLVLLNTLKAEPRFSQIVFPFNSEKQYSLSVNEKDGSVVLGLKNTKSQELPSLDNYDNSLITKILIKEYVSSYTEVVFYLSSDDVKVVSSSFKDPFRIVIDVYTKDVVEDNSNSNSDSNLNQDLSNPTSNDTSNLKLNHDISNIEHISYNDLKLLLSKYSEDKLDPNTTNYPRYVYRIDPVSNDRYTDIEVLESNPSYRLSSSQVLSFAVYLYNTGKQNQSLTLFQYLLRVDPNTFYSDPLNVWIVAESNFFQNNLVVSSGYYDILRTKYPKTIYSELSFIRNLDVKAVEVSSKIKDVDLSKYVASIDKKIEDLKGSSYSKSIKEKLMSFLYIRKMYFKDKSLNPVPSMNDKDYSNILPLLKDFVVLDEASSSPETFTNFILSSLYLNYLLDNTWKDSIAEFSDSYFKVFNSSLYEPERTYLKNKLQQKLISEFNSLYSSNSYSSVISLYETLPPSLKSISKTSSISWILAESYRYVGSNENAAEFYSKASSTDSLVDKFKSRYFQLISSVSYLNASKNNSFISSLDADTYKSWKELDLKEKNDLALSMKQNFVIDSSSKHKIKTPSLILLELWTSSLTEGSGPYSKDKNTVSTLSSLSDKFEALGMKQERKKCLELLSNLSESYTNNDKNTKLNWSNNLVVLAEDYRSSNDYQKAAETYTKAARLNEEQKVSLLYKGALLFYQSGNKSEAISLLSECASLDKQDAYYSSLCKERLNVLTK